MSSVLDPIGDRILIGNTNRRPPIPGRGDPLYQAGAAWPMPRTGPGRPAHAPPHVRGPWGPVRGAGGAVRRGAPQRGPSTWGGAWAGRPGPVRGMGQAAPARYGKWARHISIYIDIVSVTNRVQNRAHAKFQPRFYVESRHDSFRPSQNRRKTLRIDEIQEHMLKIRCMSKFQKMFRYLSNIKPQNLAFLKVLEPRT